MEIDLVILDEQWRPLHRLPPQDDWRTTVKELLRYGSRWLALYQRRSMEGVAQLRPSDIALTRSLCRRLRPLDIVLADHVIDARDDRFSFRAAGLL
ncbi:JAB domain-containing protein [Sphingobium cloacae]|uniref:JAB domain-containing protein n=1 Tax=Sphingobium cloacae TaxID=120107 RepID=UPI001E40334B|nr:JAB domain-containing protein [Sphingobium cloacae]